MRFFTVRWPIWIVELACRFLVVVDVQLADFDGLVILLSQLIDRRPDNPARSAPVGPEVDQHRLLAA